MNDTTPILDGTLREAKADAWDEGSKAMYDFITNGPPGPLVNPYRDERPVGTVSVSVGDLTEGLWCYDCKLPTGVSVVLLMTSDQPSDSYPATTVKRRCGNCGGENVGVRP